MISFSLKLIVNSFIRNCRHLLGHVRDRSIVVLRRGEGRDLDAPKPLAGNRNVE